VQGRGIEMQGWSWARDEWLRCPWNNVAGVLELRDDRVAVVLMRKREGRRKKRGRMTASG